MRAIVSQRLKLRAKRQRRKRKQLEEHAPHRAAGCNGVNIRGSGKCDSCLYPRKF
jgi:hypothetical protein